MRVKAILLPGSRCMAVQHLIKKCSFPYFVSKIEQSQSSQSPTMESQSEMLPTTWSHKKKYLSALLELIRIFIAYKTWKQGWEDKGTRSNVNFREMLLDFYMFVLPQAQNRKTRKGWRKKAPVLVPESWPSLSEFP